MGKPRNVNHVRRGGGLKGSGRAADQARSTRRAASHGENSGVRKNLAPKDNQQVAPTTAVQRGGETRSALVGVKGPVGAGGRPTRSSIRIPGR